MLVPVLLRSYVTLGNLSTSETQFPYLYPEGLDLLIIKLFKDTDFLMNQEKTKAAFHSREKLT